MAAVMTHSVAPEPEPKVQVAPTSPVWADRTPPVAPENVS